MERLAQSGVGLQEKGLHTHIFETETGSIEVISKSGDLHWKTFFYFEQFGKEFPFVVMPQLRKYTIYMKVYEEESP